LAGIPSRIVGGYQGGEVNDVNNTLVVRQFDAHAWTEIWLENRGWVRVDPTAAVSPARIELGLESALAEEERFLTDSLLSAYRFRNVSIINWLRLRYDAAAWRWQSFIVGFDSGEQINLLKLWFGEIKVGWFVAALLGSWIAILGPLTWWMTRSRRSSDRLPTEKAFAALCRILARRGIDRQIGETPLHFLKRVEAQLAANDPLVIELEKLAVRLYAPVSGSIE